ncbi:hypothetical protein IQ260_08585 [Leptolyngbya cf. ectocarpi LEGE 11479]|uniref:Uncharacterized protein n=1 Tax=Leptolyngbya cf. ectocarpi LEGE 11479 TaxID=1828722 RepID=A0A928X1G5_LEPEC|nr:hypothetical protein [Leptolyngbya ectocarpi]MBE9066707.1 hypothetical protein [Leptolyngbya cf. ectocarpi LEGE 11479]
MTLDALKSQIEQIRIKRESLVQLLDQPGLGTLRIDVNQALEEMDDLLEEFERVFKEKSQA